MNFHVLRTHLLFSFYKFTRPSTLSALYRLSSLTQAVSNPIDVIYSMKRHFSTVTQTISKHYDCCVSSQIFELLCQVCCLYCPTTLFWTTCSRWKNKQISLTHSLTHSLLHFVPLSLPSSCSSSTTPYLSLSLTLRPSLSPSPYHARHQRPSLSLSLSLSLSFIHSFVHSPGSWVQRSHPDIGTA